MRFSRKCDKCFNLFRTKSKKRNLCRHCLREKVHRLRICSGCFKEFKFFSHKKIFCNDCREIEIEYFKFVRLMKKIQEIRNINCICPGCLHDFSHCDNTALDMIFQKCHIHSKNCVDRKTNKETFLACRNCNAKQKDKCGIFRNGELLKSCV